MQKCKAIFIDFKPPVLYLRLNKNSLVKTIGKYQHLESGSVIAHINDPVVIQIDELTITFIFKSDITVKEPTLQASGGGKEAIFTFINYESGIGYANTTPLPIGNYNGKRLFMNYAIYSFGTPAIAKAIHYTFMFDPSE